ncbi:hypothetical protein EV667_3005 [Ancylobacter aquaticus]|uniref:Uncharacterized protein n=1 Tax=Ancylobacter aquaticus TaxID=100 RepID=A0A4R1I1C7_ANCAQ|nr:hypothetical protein [Ancylobacter aquaticus]TCK28987.1 hypothetical protein EV667_3005 [Ancylobacter aquaticus]
MAGKKQLQQIIAFYRLKTGETELDPRKMAEFAARNGVALPDPKDPLDLLAREISAAAREELRRDETTNRPYRAYHSLPIQHPDGQVSFVFVDIEDATRPQMHRSLTKRREQMVGDAVHLIYDADRWNSQNPHLAPIQIALDFGPDVEWRKAMDEMTDESAEGKED